MNNKQSEDILDKVRARLDEIEREREELLNFLNVAQRFINETNKNTNKNTIQASSSTTQNVGTRQLFLQVVREANGKPLHIKEIWKRAQELGATTNAKRPDSTVDLALLGFQKRGITIEKVYPAQWRWVDPTDVPA